MDTLAKLVRKHKLAKICRIGAWIVAGIAAVAIVTVSYNTWHLYLNEVANADNFPGSQAYNSPSSIFFENIPSILFDIAIYSFYCIILYSASVVFEAIGAQATATTTTTSSKSVNEPEPEESTVEEEEIVYTSLKREDILLGKQQISNHRHQSGKL